MKQVSLLILLFLVTNCRDKSKDDQVNNDFGPQGQRKVESLGPGEFQNGLNFCNTLSEFQYSIRDLERLNNRFNFEYTDCAGSKLVRNDVSVTFKKDRNDMFYMDVRDSRLKNRYYEEVISDNSSVLKGFCENLRNSRNVSNTIDVNDRLRIQVKFENSPGRVYGAQIRQFFKFSGSNNFILEKEWILYTMADSNNKEFLGLTKSSRFSQICSNRNRYMIMKHDHNRSIRP